MIPQVVIAIADSATDPFPLQPKPWTPPFGWVGIVGTGQSLSVGYDPNGIVNLSTSQPYQNLKLVDNGPNPKYPISGGVSGSTGWATAPLVEPIRLFVSGSGPGYSDNQYPNNISGAATGNNGGETLHSGLGNTLSLIWQRRYNQPYVSAHTVAGTSAAPLTQINKEGGYRSYPAAINEVAVWAALAAKAGTTYGVGAIPITHGEADYLNPAYGTGLIQLANDFAADIRAITGQQAAPILFVSQQSTEPGGVGGSAVQVWRLGVTNPTQFVCTGPKYQYLYSQDGLHLIAAGYERLGCKYAEIIDIVVNQGMAWAPLQPMSVTRSGAIITIAMNVPNPPIAWDAHVPQPHLLFNTAWAAGNGFEVLDSTSAQLTISSATIVGNSVVLTLSAIPTNLPLVVNYAITQDSTGTNGGSPYGLIGTLRDSDPFVGADAETIACNVTSNSAVITPVTAGGFARRTKYDNVSGSGLPAGTVALTFDNNNAPAQITLSSPWAGASGTATLAMAHAHPNFCVHFSWPGVT